MKTIPLYLLLALLATTACRQTYNPPVIANPPNYLVVEGFIENNGADSTLFTLSRTVKLDSNAYTAEQGASVTVEGTDNSIFRLGEVNNGAYGARLPFLNSNVTYRLHIATSGGKQYASDYVPIVTDPPIDSISWARKDNPPNAGIQIYANTHDPNNNTHYYRWEYQETWEFHAAFYATIKYTPATGIVGYGPNTTYYCWHNDKSSSVLIASSTQLSQDVIYEAPVVLIPLNSQQLQIKYSILVKQYALTKDAFNWWQILQKNTEQIGSIFGVQPSANPGNIHSLTDTTEQVLGFVGGGSTRTQRIFITNAQVLPWDYETDCQDNKVSPDPATLSNEFAGGNLPWSQDVMPPSVHVAFKTCVDCTFSGTNIPPYFWQ